MAEYVVPKQQQEDLKSGFESLEMAEDILKKLRLAGEPNPEAEVRIRELKKRGKRFAAAFDIDVGGK